MMSFQRAALLVVDFAGCVGLLFLATSSAYLSYLIFWRLRLPFNSKMLPAALPPLDGLPQVLLQIPIYNELHVAEGTIRAAAALEWLPNKLSIQVLDSSTNSTTHMVRAVVEELRSAGLHIELIRRNNREGYKAGALQAGHVLSSAPYIAILDADFRAPPGWLRNMVGVLLQESQVAFAQSRLDYRNADTNRLTRVQQLLHDAHFITEQTVRSSRGLPMNCSTGVVWRRSALEESGGWSDDTLVEDLDLALRACLRGWRGLLVSEPTPFGELPERWQDWRAQQNRWSNGHIQVARKLLKTVWRSNLTIEAKIVTSLNLSMPLALPGLAILCLSIFAGATMRGSLMPYAPILIPGLITAIVILVGWTLPPVYWLRRSSLGQYLRNLLNCALVHLHLSMMNSVDIVGTALGKKRGWGR
jgi:cellulose synthase/poly-beta-1,6-N-acetylglucosamine synthase-like glycosyltransferase